MKSKLLVGLILGLAAIVLVVAVALDIGGRQGPVEGAVASAQSLATQEPSAPSSVSASSGTPSTGGSKDSKDEKDSKISEKSKASKNKDSGREEDAPKPEATRPTWDPQPSASETRAEVPEEAKASEFSLPKTEPREPVLAKAPKTGVAEGKLTKGFPKKAVPVPDRTSIVQSSVEQQAELVFVGFEGRSSDSVEEVLAFYSKHFEQQGWLATQSEPAVGQTRLSGFFGTESTTITVRQLPTGATAVVAAGVFEIQE
ncbi:hypothetical protein ACTXL8_11180 [Glutamicibacter arilaitensis]|uniref:hypothetical protein n=1 Tax=Glutamicibacter arilaitensis TaxID=256701 RepID=UPI003FD3D673